MLGHSLPEYTPIIFVFVIFWGQHFYINNDLLKKLSPYFKCKKTFDRIHFTVRPM